MREGNLLEYNHDTLLMLTFTDLLKSMFVSSALIYALLIDKSADLYITSIELLFYCVVRTGEQIPTLRYPTARRIYILLMLVVYYIA